MDSDNIMTFSGYYAEERDNLVEVLSTFKDWKVSTRRHWNWRSFGWKWAIDVEGITDEQGLRFVQLLIEKMHNRG